MDDETLAAEIKAQCMSGDWEADHGRADALVIKQLRALGYSKTADARDEVGKWFA